MWWMKTLRVQLKALEQFLLNDQKDTAELLHQLRWQRDSADCTELREVWHSQ